MHSERHIICDDCITTVFAMDFRIKSFLLLLFATNILASDEKPKVIIIGAGSAGIAAASRLLQNGITDVTILEAENRIGGRIWSKKIGDYVVDVGALSMSGEDTEILDMVKSFNLLSSSPLIFKDELLKIQILPSSDMKLVMDGANNFDETDEKISNDETELSSWRRYLESILNKAFDKRGVKTQLRESILHSVLSYTAAEAGINDWSAIPLNETAINEGISYTWKEKGFQIILDILMKKYPNPEEELPIKDKTLLNKKVNKIRYNENGLVKVTTADGNEYTADHVICTVSLGVLKSDHQTLFDPPLPEKHVNSIKNMEFAHEENIFFFYNEPWWSSDDSIGGKIFYWTEKDRKEIENDTGKKWLLGVLGTDASENQPKLLSIIIDKSHYEGAKKIPDEIFKKQTVELIRRFYRGFNNITEPNEIIRTSWESNENFRGSSSYYTSKTIVSDASVEDLAEPVLRNDVPILQFAGEATEYGATVNSAIVSGWREADRLIDIYVKKE